MTSYIQDIPSVRLPHVPEFLNHAWYKYYIYINQDFLSSEWSRDRILSEILSSGYPVFSGSCSEIYLEKCFLDAGLAPPERLPIAKELGETSLMFLVHLTISSQQMNILS